MILYGNKKKYDYFLLLLENVLPKQHLNKETCVFNRVKCLQEIR